MILKAIDVFNGIKEREAEISGIPHLVRIMVNLAEIPLYEVCRMMSLNPAKVIKMDDKIGSIEIGKNADFTILDNDLRVSKVILSGEIAYARQEN